MKLLAGTSPSSPLQFALLALQRNLHVPFNGSGPASGGRDDRHGAYPESDIALCQRATAATVPGHAATVPGHDAGPAVGPRQPSGETKLQPTDEEARCNDPHYPLPRALQEPNWPLYLRNYFGLRQLAALGGG